MSYWPVALMPPPLKLSKNWPAGQFLVVTVAPMSFQLLIRNSSSAARCGLPEVVPSTHASLTPFLLRVPSAALVHPSESSSEFALATLRLKAATLSSWYGDSVDGRNVFIGLPMPPTSWLFSPTRSEASQMAWRSGLSSLNTVGLPQVGAYC